MPISLLPKGKIERGPEISIDFFRQNIGSAIALGILLFVFVVYGALLGFEAFLHRELQAIRDQVLAIQEKRDIKAEEGARDLGIRIAHIGLLLDTHPLSTRIFEFAEDMTHPQAQLTNFNFEIQDSIVTLEGATQNYVTFGEQIIALEQSKSIRNLEILDVEKDKSGQITFTVLFEIDEGIYR